MFSLKKIFLSISSLKTAIFLLLLIAGSSALGTLIPQNQTPQKYIEVFKEHPLFGFVNGNMILLLELDHIYSSIWFLFLLLWLGLALSICSYRRQWPILKKALEWIDYKKPTQISKLAIAQTVPINPSKIIFAKLASSLEKEGWKVKSQPGRIAARKGLIGRVGPPIIHLGLILLMSGAAWGALKGQKYEQFLVPGDSFDLITPTQIKQLSLKLKTFNIDRDPAGRTEQFRSKIELIDPQNDKIQLQEASVNHPIRYKGLTIYQADWSLAAITLQISENPQLQLPLRKFPELGDQIWGLVLPTTKDGENPLLISLSSEKGPIRIFDDKGSLIESLRPGGEQKIVKNVPIRVIDVLPSSGLLLKKDPGIPLVYMGFTITLIGGLLSIISTQQLWAVSDEENKCIHIGGISNRNLSGLANEMPRLISNSEL